MVSVDYDGTSNRKCNMDRRRGDFLPQRVHLNNHNSSTYKPIKHTYIAWVYESTGSGSGLIVRNGHLIRIANNETFIASNLI
jgi:hypothetical protein